MTKRNSKANRWVFTLLGALSGAVVCGSLFCVAIEISGEREQEAIQHEIRKRADKASIGKSRNCGSARTLSATASRGF